MRLDVLVPVRSAVAVLWADGGQRRARRNAWAAMSADAARARGRAEADAALRAVQETAPAAPAGASG